MKAIVFFQQNKIKDYVAKNTEWYIEYCRKIVSLYTHCKSLQKNVISKEKDLLKAVAQETYDDLKYFYDKHNEADVNLFAINNPYYEVVDIFYQKYRSSDYEKVAQNKFELYKKLPLNEYDILWQTDIITSFLDEKIEENKKFVGNYLLDFSLFLMNYNLFYSLEAVIEGK